MTSAPQKPSTLKVIIAFALVYIVWGSTYFFIRISVHSIPPFMLGALRFTTAGLIMLVWCIIKREKIWVIKDIKQSGISGLMILFGANGSLIWAEQMVPSAVAAILVSAAPVWFVLLDVSNWRVNFKNTSTILGLIIGFLGVLLLFGEQFSNSLKGGGAENLPAMMVIILGSMLWAGGSLYSKYKASGSSATVNTTWQMLIAGIAFIPVSLIAGEPEHFDPSSVPAEAWYSLIYLIIFGSIVAFSAYVWLLKVKSATQVSTYAYVNPVIALLLGVLIANEEISWLQAGGLFVILASVLLINFSKYRKAKQPVLSVE
ncbi:EamA family transporter [Pedobacter punctiformis]|uniref:EamA family transporter n=1 Tax=Pedobacter punctiformis TaxID=3004097 RepID=A0ABT4LDA1_9SPHI|nr:EamA family transporter [Pedobacter sp. HCMS5-2]MCZ4245902.1 EamA family transporter [Pedobacter sp. HCMS5-2]